MTASRHARIARRAAALVALGVTLTLLATVARGSWAAPFRVAAFLPAPPMRSVGELSREHERILLAVEDPRFFRHHGVDLSTPGAGWTTITQGLVKILYFESFRPGPLAKLEQTLLAIGFDASTPKRLQLDLFWNVAYMGSNETGDVIGIPRAARAYFGRDVTELERDEYLALVAMLVAPNRYSPVRNRAASAERIARIERVLAGQCRDLSWRDVEYEACAEVH